MIGLVGIGVILLCAVALSVDRKRIHSRTAVKALLLQVLLAILVLRTPVFELFRIAGAAISSLISYGEAGSVFVFGDLASSQGHAGVLFAFQVLPVIIFVASLFAVLYHLGIMQWLVRGMAVGMRHILAVSGAESLSVASNVFLGAVEAAVSVRPYIGDMTKSELMVLMTGGMATISGALMVAYAAIAGAPVEHLLTAVVINAPGAIGMAKIIVPETLTPKTISSIPRGDLKSTENVFHAAAEGAVAGLRLCLSVGALLIAFVGLIAAVNGIIGGVKDGAGLHWLPEDFRVEIVLGWFFRPIAWLAGVDWTDASLVGQLLGTRMVLNEFVAYVELGKVRECLSPRSFMIASYGLCGFANFTSIGIQIGGVASLIDDRTKRMSQQAVMAKLGLRAMLAASMANLLTATLVGFLLG